MAISNSAVAQQIIIQAQQGDTFDRVLKFWTDEAKTVPLDLTTSNFQINAYSGGNTVVLNFTAAITAPNILTISKTAAQMMIPVLSYRFDLKMIPADLSVITLIGGVFQIVNK